MAHFIENDLLINFLFSAANFSHMYLVVAVLISITCCGIFILINEFTRPLVLLWCGSIKVDFYSSCVLRKIGYCKNHKGNIIRDVTSKPWAYGTAVFIHKNPI